MIRSRAFYIALAATLVGSSAGLVLAQPADTPTNPFATEVAAPAIGAKLFNATCNACHGDNAVGSPRGPNLEGVAGEGAFDIFTTIQKGVPGTGMPPFAAMNPNDIWHLVSFVQSLANGGPSAQSIAAAAAAPAASAAPAAGAGRAGAGGGRGGGGAAAAGRGGRGAAPAPAAPAVAEVVPGNVAHGAQLYAANGCASCHAINGGGSPLAADLTTEGTKPSAQIRSGVLHMAAPAAGRGGGGGGRGGGGVFQMTEVTLKTGVKVTGLVKTQDSFNLSLQKPDGSWVLLEKSKIASTRVIANSGMPTDVAARLGGDAGVQDVVAYLASLKAANPDQMARNNPAPVVSYERLVKSASEPQNWMTYWGGYNGQHFTELTQITTANVRNLQARWTANLPAPGSLQAVPLVIDGVMYVSGAPGDVYAFDARSGLQLWKFSRKQDVVNPYQINPSNRGVAVLGGRVFYNTLDDNLIALDAHTGRELWEKRLGDTMIGITMTGAPLALKDKIVVGMSGGEGGVNGWLQAFDPATGRALWKFDVVPPPGQPGNETWAGDSWKLGGGATWLTGSYDPETNLVIWATGNPGPDFDRVIRAGDNLYTCSVVAVNADTGKLVWHYQFSPNDSHDWDSVQDMVLADRMVDGKMRKVLLHADRNGFYYMLDRTNGKLIHATNFVYQTWNKGFDANGRPIVDPNTLATLIGNRVYPATGGTNFQAPSLDNKNGVFYLAYVDAEGFAAYAPQVFEPGKTYYGRSPVARPAPLRGSIQGIKALDANTGKMLWDFPLTRGGLQQGVLGSRGGTLFAATAEGYFIGLDMKTGKLLWKFYTGGNISSSPMSYAVDGKQYVAIVAANTLHTFALPDAPPPAPAKAAPKPAAAR